MIVERRRVATANAMFRALSPLHRRWAPDPTAWAFRGHANSSWMLQPSSRRSGAFDRLRLGIPRPLCTSGCQIMAEGSVLSTFYRMVDQGGFAVPDDGVHLRHDRTWDEIVRPYMSGAMEGTRHWPPPLLHAIAALAQHHGLPTPLLDWTRRPLVALYFAAKQAAQWLAGWQQAPTDSKQALTVWAIRPNEVQRAIRSPSHEFDVILAPSATNPNLRAQAGVFTLDYGPNRDSSTMPYEVPLDDALKKAVEGEADAAGEPHMWRFDAPWTIAPQLLRWLEAHGVTAATIFPGLDGVAESLRERALWAPDTTDGEE